jgi:energy-coupling factor transporter ATP-binding protein EcfA2
LSFFHILNYITNIFLNILFRQYNSTCINAVKLIVLQKHNKEMIKIKNVFGVDGLSLVGLGLFTNALPLGVSGTWAIVLGGGLLLYDFYLRHDNKFDRLFKNCNLCIRADGKAIIPYLMKKQKHETSTDYIFNLPAGMKLDNFRQKTDEVSQFLKKPVSWDYNNGVIIMTVKEELKKNYPFKLIHYDDPLKVCFAYSSEGPFVFDIEESVHTLIGGSTGWGKSAMLRVLSVILLSKPIDLYLVDFMRVELGLFKKKCTGFCGTAEEFSYLLDDLADISQKRLKMFEKKSVSSIRSWNKKFSPLKYIVVLIDEFAAIAQDKSIMAKFELRTAQDRKVGIHYIAATQRCSVNVISGTVKNNMNTRICFKVATDTDSQVVLDENGAEKLRYPGRCLIKADKTRECQVMYLSEDEAREAVYGTKK